MLDVASINKKINDETFQNKTSLDVIFIPDSYVYGNITQKVIFIKQKPNLILHNNNPKLILT